MSVRQYSEGLSEGALYGRPYFAIRGPPSRPHFCLESAPFWAPATALWGISDGVVP